MHRISEIAKVTFTLSRKSSKTREFQTQLLHYFSKSDNKSNHHHPVWCVRRCLSRTNLMHILVRNQVYHHTPTRMICHYTNSDDLWKNCEPLCTLSERLFDTPLKQKLRTSTSLMLLRRSVFECMYIIMSFCTDVSCDLDII